MFGKHVGIRGKQLDSYSYNCGGGMTGGYHRKNIKRYGSQALISVESAQWYYNDPKVSEYLTAVSVLDELEEVIRKYKMNYWDGKKFCDEFVHDGESESYSFELDDACISFSSQIYPMEYREKLSELDTIIEKYIKSGEKLPGLVNSRINKEDNYSLPEGELVIYVCSYARDLLGLRILNGTDNDVELSNTYKLINTDTAEVIYEAKIPYGGRFSKHTNDELVLRLQERLQAGKYKLVFSDLEIPFIIS